MLPRKLCWGTDFREVKISQVPKIIEFWQCIFILSCQSSLLNPSLEGYWKLSGVDPRSYVPLQQPLWALSTQGNYDLAFLLKLFPSGYMECLEPSDFNHACYEPWSLYDHCAWCLGLISAILLALQLINKAHNPCNVQNNGGHCFMYSSWQG